MTFKKGSGREELYDAVGSNSTPTAKSGTEI